jgi:hypothetical protein
MAVPDWIVQQWVRVGLQHFHDLELLIIEIIAPYAQDDDVDWNLADVIDIHLGVKGRLLRVETGSSECWFWKHDDCEETLNWSDCDECLSSSSCMKLNMLG